MKDPCPIPDIPEKSLWIISRSDTLLVVESDGSVSLPQYEQISTLQDRFTRTHPLGFFKGLPVFCADVGMDAAAPHGMSFRGLWSILDGLGDELFAAVSRAYSLSYWDRIHKFCRRCGTSIDFPTGKHSKTCPACGMRDYPAVTPAIIVAVLKEGELLLACGKRFTADYYSLIAGHVEPGETFEACIRREVFEEVGIRIRNAHYFGSQPWPFPHAIMAGFTAEYAGGDIRFDKKELTDAEWFNSSNLPKLPQRGTIARQMIDCLLKI